MSTVRSIMTRNVVTFSPETPIREAMETLCTEHLSGAPVVSGRRVVGVVSMTDLLSFIVTTRDREQNETGETFTDEWEDREEESEDEDIQELTTEDEILDEWVQETDSLLDEAEPALKGFLDQHVVEEVMTADVVSVLPGAKVSTAAALMEKHGIHRVLVLEGEKLQGIVSSLDIARDLTRRATRV